MRSTVHQNTVTKQFNGTTSAVWNKQEVDTEQEHKEALQLGKPFSQPSATGSADDKPTPPTPISFDFSKLPIFPPKQARIQPKLKINAPGDRYEQEADRVAEQVMRMPGPQVQRKPQWGLPTQPNPFAIQRKCDPCAKEDEETLHAKSAGNIGGIVAPGIAQQIQSSRGSGQPMETCTRSFMEARFGADFGEVKIHTDGNAAQLNRNLQARAFTHGHDIYFNQGQYSPGAGDGRRLLAHELTHVVQQSQSKILAFGSIRGNDGALKLSEVNGELLQMSPGDSLEIAERIRTLIHTRDPIAGPNLAYQAFPILEGLDDSAMMEVLNHLSVDEINELIVSDSTSKTPRIAAALNSVSQSRQAGTTAQAQTTISPFTQTSTATGATLGTTQGHTVQAFFFQGTSNRKALILGGVHGSEPGGVEVVRNLLAMLQSPGSPTPFFSVVIVPELFSANLHSSRSLADRRTSGGTVRSMSPLARNGVEPTPDPNRQFPSVGSDPVTNSRLGCVVDKQDRCVEPENLVLLDLINRFQPERVANVHGHSIPTARPARAATATQPARPAQNVRDVLLAEGGPSITTDPRPGHEREDRALTLTMASEAHRRGVGVPGNFIGTTDETTEYPTGTAPRLSSGVSFGAWGSHATPTRPAMNIVLIETFGNRTSADGNAAQQAARRTELMNLAEILRDFFLVDPATI